MKSRGTKMNDCEFCDLNINAGQKIIMENESCYFLQLDELQKKEGTLEGAGVIIPKNHRGTVFDLTDQEWTDTYHLLRKVKVHIDNKHKPDGYNIGWNVYETGGQHIGHTHMHIMPRYQDEKLAGKGVRSHLKDKSNGRTQNDQIS